jgi:molybdopterin-synthase adenylyltransferase
MSQSSESHASFATPNRIQDRYSRQRLFSPIGEEGQTRIGKARVLVVGCGALGSVIANTLARAGIGHLRIVDRDFVDLSNLQRQVLYTEEDVRSQLPKSIAATQYLRKVNSEISIEPLVADVDDRNIRDLVSGIDIIADGTDNFETRFLLNDIAAKSKIPWVYGGCLGAEGQSLTIIPDQTPCLRCVLGDAPPPGTMPTCDSAGVIAPIVNIVASWQASEVLKIASGNIGATSKSLVIFDLWENTIRQVRLDRLREQQDCDTCQGRDFPWLQGDRRNTAAILCGRNSVQLASPQGQLVNLAAIGEQWTGLGEIVRNPYLVRLRLPQLEITVFVDGRTIVSGTTDVSEARSIVARYVGA